MWKVEPEINFIKLFVYSLIILFFGNVKLIYIPFLSFIIIPVLSLDTLTNELSNYTLVFISTFWLLVMHFEYKLKINFSLIKYKRIILIMTLLFSFFLIFYFFGRVQSFNPLILLSDVYSFREDNKVEGFEGYLIGWLPTVVLPFLIFRYKKKIILQLLVAVLFSVFIFLITGVKSWLFLSFLLLLPYYFTRYKILKFFPIFNLAIVGFTYLFKNLFFLAFMDRILYVTPLYTLRYLEFFNTHDLMFFEDSKLSIFSPFPEKYTESVGILIDSAYNGGGMNANVGIIGTAYSDLGIFGLILITSSVILIISNFFSRKGPWALSLFLMYIYLSSNAPPLDLFITHGLIINIILIKFLATIDKNS